MGSHTIFYILWFVSVGHLMRFPSQGGLIYLAVLAYAAIL